MQRLELFELEDQPWFPQVIRSGITDFLAFLANASEAPYLPFVARLRLAMERMGELTLVDLCSGGGGPLPTLLTLLRAGGYPARGLLTDLYPDVRRFEAIRGRKPEAIDYLDAPVDAAAVPASARGFRLICNAFHHFPPEEARRVLADSVENAQGIAILEVAERSKRALYTMLLPSFLMLGAIPFLRPFRPSRFVFSTVVPVIPLCFMWDAIVSCLRVYSPEELRGLLAQVPGATTYRWELGRLPTGWLYLIGTPKLVALPDRARVDAHN